LLSVVVQHNLYVVILDLMAKCYDPTDHHLANLQKLNLGT